MTGLDFYDTAAQVLPLLFITLVVEMKFYDPAAIKGGAPATTRLKAYLSTTLVFLVGEGAALWTLYFDKPSKFVGWCVVNAMLVVGGMIITTPIWPMVARIDAELQGEQQTPKYLPKALAASFIIKTLAVTILAFVMLG